MTGLVGKRAAASGRVGGDLAARPPGRGASPARNRRTTLARLRPRKRRDCDASTSVTSDTLRTMRSNSSVICLVASLALLLLGGCGDPDPGTSDAGCTDRAACAVPPPSTCSDDGQSLRSAVAFTGCDEAGECQYEYTTEQCPLGCENGDCIEPVSPCADVVCGEPPSAPWCDGNTARWYELPGTCVVEDDQAECDYDRESRNCRDDICFEGACQPVSCTFLTCDSPPDDFCDGTVAIRHPRLGTCDEEDIECDYSPQTEDCAESGLTCDGGECVTGPCTGVVCEEPPEPTCESGVATTWDATGTCEFGECTYGSAEVDCVAADMQCVDGACVPLCDPASCVSAPDPTCDGNDAIVFGDDGDCGEGDTCVYPEIRTACGPLGLVCVEGECVDNPACESIVCDAPPTADCDGEVAVTYADDGTCFGEGHCDYAESRRDCALGGQVCYAGDCDDFCDVAACIDPPDDYCDGHVSVIHSAVGACVDDACEYESFREDCDAAGTYCSAGDCVRRCVDEACTTPPEEAWCVGNSLWGFDGPGFCGAGDDCEYPEAFLRDCGSAGDVCFAGECLSTCGGVFCDDPPRARCDDDELVVSEGSGVCAEGDVCTYAEIRTNCADDGLACGSVPGPAAFGCIDACETLICDALPDSYCDGETLVQSFFPSSCEDSACLYTESRINCTALGDICLDGACVDACMGIVCNTPPDDVCEGTIARDYRETGACEFGECSYFVDDRDCDLSFLECVDGACIDLCDAVTCDDPPADGCDEEGRIVYWLDEPGLCIGGECSFFADEVVDCPSVGLACAESGPPPTLECVDPCATVICGPGPDPFCVDDVANRFSESVCDFGECYSDPIFVDCQDLGAVCVDGDCDDGCAGVECPPVGHAVCDGHVARTYLASPPTCVAGECRYDAEEVDCLETGRDCDDGLCVTVGDICALVECASRGVFCEGDSVVEDAGPGTCHGGPPTTCDYSGVATRTPCAAPSGCAGGACERVPQPGELVITEIFFDAEGTDLDAEWFEVFNATDDELVLLGVTVTNARDQSFVVESDLRVAAGDHIVFGSGAGGVPDGPDYEYGYFEFTLANSGEDLVLARASGIIDHVSFGGPLWTFAPGASLSLSSALTDAEENDNSTAWCLGTDEYDGAGGPRGTPGTANPACP